MTLASLKNGVCRSASPGMPAPRRGCPFEACHASAQVEAL
jgi:hypothetical protein